MSDFIRDVVRRGAGIMTPVALWPSTTMSILSECFPQPLVPALPDGPYSSQTIEEMPNTPLAEPSERSSNELPSTDAASTLHQPPMHSAFPLPQSSIPGSDIRVRLPQPKDMIMRRTEKGKSDLSRPKVSSVRSESGSENLSGSDLGSDFEPASESKDARLIEPYETTEQVLVEQSTSTSTFPLPQSSIPGSDIQVRLPQPKDVIMRRTKKGKSDLSRLKVGSVRSESGSENLSGSDLGSDSEPASESKDARLIEPHKTTKQVLVEQSTPTTTIVQNHAASQPSNSVEQPSVVMHHNTRRMTHKMLSAPRPPAISGHEITQMSEDIEPKVREAKADKATIIERDYVEKVDRLDSERPSSPITYIDRNLSSTAAIMQKPKETASIIEVAAVPDVSNKMQTVKIARREVFLELKNGEAPLTMQPVTIPRKKILMEIEAPVCRPPVHAARAMHAKSEKPDGAQHEQRLVQVHIGTIEVQPATPAPLPSKPHPRTPAILGFDEYEMVRNYMS